MTSVPEESWFLRLQPQHDPLTAEQYEVLPEDISKTIEIIDGYVIFCESPTRRHQTATRRLANLIEGFARSETRTGRGCYAVNHDVDLRICDVPLTNLQPDVVLHGCLDDDERLRAEHALLVLEVVSPGSKTRDTSDKVVEYAKAGIPHYWIVWLDNLGVSEIERYQLDRGTGCYKHLGTFMRDETGEPMQVTTPIPMSVDWAALEY